MGSGQKEYSLSLTLPGYRTTNLFFTVSGKEPRTISVELTTNDYAQAMERARAKLSANVPDYAGALAEVDKALKIRSTADALSLKQEIQFRSHVSNARQFERNRDYAKALAELDAALILRPTDAEALAFKRTVAEEKKRLDQSLAAKRRAHPQQIFRTMSEKYQYDELFEAQTLQFKGTLETVRNAIIAGLARKPSWNLTGNHKRDDDTSVLQFETQGFGSKHSALVVAGQTADNEVSVYFKIISLSLGSNIQIGFTGISEESYKPMHPRYVPEARVPAIQRNLARDTQDFRVRIEDEMR